MVTINGFEFGEKQYHNGETIFHKVPLVSKVLNNIVMKYEDDKDIIKCLIARQWLADEEPDAQCVLTMEYCVYERMDRELDTLIFTMKYLADILGKFNFDKVVISDPHSNVCVDQLEKAGIRVKVKNIDELINPILKDFKPDYLFFPDKGARAKYVPLLSDCDIPFFMGDKTRDVMQLGRIVDYELIDPPELEDKRVLIIDDICCLGGTAYLAATEMKKLKAKEVALFVTHCENGVFVGKLLKPEEDGTYMVDKVYTSGTLPLNNTHDHLIIM